MARSRSNGGAPPAGLTPIAELAAMVDAAEDSNSPIELRERMAEIELALEDLGWVRMGYETQGELSRSGLRKLEIICRQLFLKHPLINHAVNVGTHYVWGQGISVVAKSAEVNKVVQAWWDLKDNRKELTGHRARMLKERELWLTGNVFLVLFTEPIRGTVRLRSIAFSEIEEVIANPEDRRDVWFYHRRWTQGTVYDPEIGISVGTETMEAYYPDWQHNPPAGPNRPETINGKPVKWDAPIYHMKAGGLDNMRFGVPEIFPAVDWARAVQADLENYATVRKALARFAFQLTVKGNQKTVDATKAALASTVGVLNSTGEANPPPVAGSTLIQREGAARLEPIRTAGMQPNPDEGRRLGLMVAAGTHIPETMLWGDATLGNYATAKSLDRPTELAFLTRQKDWMDTFQDIAATYVVDQAALARKGPLKSKKQTDPYSGEPVVLVLDKSGQPLDRRVDIEFPSILEHDQKDTVEAIVSAATLNGQAAQGLVDKRTLSRLLLVALRVNNVDEVLQTIHPDEPNPPAVDPGGVPPSPAPPPAAPAEPSPPPAVPMPPAASQESVDALRLQFDALTALVAAQKPRTQEELLEVVVKVAEATRTDIVPFLEAVRLQGEAVVAAVGRPVQMSLELPAPPPPRRVSRETKFQQDAKGNIVGKTEVETEAADDEPAYSMPDGSYPINTCADVSDAAKLAHNSKTYSFEDVKAMVLRAKTGLGCSDDVLPDTWKED